MHGLILFAHGARDPLWARPFEAVAERCRALAPERPLQLAYLEFMAPDLAAAGAALVQQGCIEVAVLPLFLGAGGHVRRDLPRQLEALKLAHPDVHWVLHASAGESPDLVECLAQLAVSLP